MRYFTKEMWAGWQEEDSPFNESHVKGRAAAYWSQFAKLEPRLGRSTATFLRTASLHDSRLIAMTTRDLNAHDRRPPKRYPTVVELILRPMNRSYPNYHLRYSSIRRVSFDFPSDRPLFHCEAGGIDDWGYDEITAADRQFLSHEVVFSSGAILLIEFLKLSCRKVNASPG